MDLDKNISLNEDIHSNKFLFNTQLSVNETNKSLDSSIQLTNFFPQKQIALLDLDYFFAQCETIRNPLIKDLPVVIIVQTIRGSGAVATCNYLARDLKIRSGMVLSLAKKLANNETIFINADKQYYTQISLKVFEIIDFFCDSVEQTSIDEAYLDLTNPLGFEKAQKICLNIKNKLKNDLGLSCSIGLSFNKLLAKMACEEKKPDGFTIIPYSKKDDFLLKKNVKKIHGVGPNLELLLKNIGVYKIGDLRKIHLEKLIELFGESKGSMLYNYSRGIDDRVIIVNREKQQISRMITLKKDSIVFDEIKNSLDFLCEIVFNESKKLQKQFKTCSLIVIESDFETITRSKTFDGKIDFEKFKEIIYFLLRDYISDSTKLIRRVGVRISNFDEDYGFQKKLLDF
ncbi:MAG: DNA polymerase IV [Candidatus ainarchaeum sp.]|nr:DNA polymerase IV [Candidatus ainarchaeum sp.]